MGLIKAGIGALGGTMADQWKEFFYCEAIDKEVIVTKGQKRTSSLFTIHLMFREQRTEKKEQGREFGAAHGK